MEDVRRLSQRFSTQLRSHPLWIGSTVESGGGQPDPSRSLSQSPSITRHSSPSRPVLPSIEGMEPSGGAGGLDNGNPVVAKDSTPLSGSPTDTRGYGSVDTVPDISISGPDQDYLATAMAPYSGPQTPLPSPVAPPRHIHIHTHTHTNSHPKANRTPSASPSPPPGLQSDSAVVDHASRSSTPTSTASRPTVSLPLHLEDGSPSTASVSGSFSASTPGQGQGAVATTPRGDAESVDNLVDAASVLITSPTPTSPAQDWSLELVSLNSPLEDGHSHSHSSLEATIPVDIPKNASFTTLHSNNGGGGGGGGGSISASSGSHGSSNGLHLVATDSGGKDKEKKVTTGLNPSVAIGHGHRHNSDASSIGSSIGKSKSNDKKRQRWYQSLYPTYKQRSEEFQKLFPTIPKKERLLVDYSCALQRDILVQGRIYASQHHICFYAKIIAWETTICTPWKQVTGLSKERTAKIIPNAMSYSTDTEQYYFTSFGQRDKTFTTLYRIWQGAVRDQPMNLEEMWSFVHYLYGDELGLTSDDEDYVQPAYLSSLPELMVAVNAAAGGEEEEEDDEEHAHKEDHVDMVDNVIPVSSLALNRNEARRNDSISSSNGSGSEGRLEDDHSPLFIPLLPAGAQTFVDHHFHIPFDQLFLVLFSESTLLKEMYVRRKMFDTKFGQWTLDPTTDCQIRDVKYCTIIGPKTIRTEERQTLLKESVSGRLHLVDSVAQNHGAPYSDSFSVVSHYMVCKLEGAEGICVTRLRIATEIVFRKANWAVKALLEKGVMEQLKDYMADLKSRLITYEAELATAPRDDEFAGETEATGSMALARPSGKSVTLTRESGVATFTAGSASASASGQSTLRRTRSSAPPGTMEEDREGPVEMGRIFVSQAEYGRLKRLIYLVLGLLLINSVLFGQVWLRDASGGNRGTLSPTTSAAADMKETSSSSSTGGGDDSAFASRSARRKSAEDEWLQLLSRLVDGHHQDKSLRSLNDGLQMLLAGIQKVSDALEDLQTKLATYDPPSTARPPLWPDSNDTR